MAETFWGIKLAKTSSGSLYLVTEIAKNRRYISTMGQLCGIWDLVRKQKGWTGSELTNIDTQANVLQKVICHLVYEIVESRSSSCSYCRRKRASAERFNMDLLYITIAFAVFVCHCFVVLFVHLLIFIYHLSV